MVVLLGQAGDGDGADGAGASGAGVLSSKLISLNIGADIGAKSSGMFAWSSNAMSKSDGNGKSSFICSFVSTSISVIGDWAGDLRYRLWYRCFRVLLRARWRLCSREQVGVRE